MGIVKDEKGHRYGRLLVLEQAEKPNPNASGLIGYVSAIVVIKK